MTFFRHFGSKEALIVEDPYDPLIVAAVAAQPRELAALSRVVRGTRTAWREQSVDMPAPRERLIIAANTPTLRPAMLANTQRTQDLIAAQLEADGTDRTIAAVVAAAVLAALMTALLAWAKADPDTDLNAAIEGALRALEEEPND